MSIASYIYDKYQSIKTTTLYYLYIFLNYISNTSDKIKDIISDKYPETLNKTTIYFDFETTGLNPFHDRIIDYAFLREVIPEQLKQHSKLSPKTNDTQADILDEFLGEVETSSDTFYNKVSKTANESGNIILSSTNSESVEEGQSKTENQSTTESSTQILESLVNPDCKFDKKITDITGIHPDHLEDKLPISSHLANIYDYIDPSSSTNTNAKTINSIYLVAHNCHGFDKIFLERLFPESSRKSWHYIDTLMLAKKLMPRQKSYSLSNLAKHFNIMEGKHRASSDTICLRFVYHKLVEILGNNTGFPVDYYLENPDKVCEFIAV